MLPRYRKVIDFARSRGVRYFGLDSDGQIDPLIPVWMDAGIDILYPFEVQAGMDVLAVRRKYGKSLRIWGGVDKRVLAPGKEAIDAELRRVAPLIPKAVTCPCSTTARRPTCRTRTTAISCGNCRTTCKPMSWPR